MKKILYISLAIATLAMVSCSDDKSDGVETPGVVLPADSQIAFTAVSVSSNDGVAETTTANIENFGIFVDQSDEFVSDYFNVEVTNEDGDWQSAETMFWHSLDEETTFAAYSPYNSVLAFSTIEQLSQAMDSIYDSGFIKADQSTEEAYKASDLLYAIGTFIPSAGNGAVASGEIVYWDGFVKTQFAHMCALVVFEIELTQQYMDIDTDNYPTATLVEALSGGDRSTISFVTIEDLDENDRRMITVKTIIEPCTPVSNTSLSLEVNTGDGISTWSSTSLPTQFVAGKIYTVSNLTLGDEIITGLGDISVKAWEDANEEDITTDFTLD